MINWTVKILDRILVVLGAIVLIQFPLFIHQYQNQLIGHVEELKWQVNMMKNSSTRSGKSLEQYIQKFIEHPDQDVSSQGIVMKMTYIRWNKLSEALLHLQKASSLTRPWVFLSYLQSDIVRSTVQSFKPGLPFTKESLLYALIGMGLGSSLFYGMRFTGRKIRIFLK